MLASDIAAMMTKTYSRLFNFIPYLIFIAVLVYFCDNTFALFDFPVDDAWIHRIYSRAMAMGEGMAYNTGIQETGSTSPFWVILTAPAHWLAYWGNTAVVVAVKLIGCALTMLSLYFVQRISLHLSKSFLTSILAAGLFALEPRLIFSALSGMEPTLLLTLLLGTIWATLYQRRYTALLFIGLAPVTRPETIVLAPMLVLALCLQTRAWSLLRQPATWLLVTVPFISWLLFCQITTGKWLPNTFYAKATSFVLGKEQMFTVFYALQIHGLASTYLLWPGLIAFIILCWNYPARINRLTFLLLLLAPIIFAIIVVCGRVVLLDGYYWTRWLDPFSLLLTAFLTIGIATIVRGLPVLVPATVITTLTPQHTQRLFTFIGLLLILLAVPKYNFSLQERKFHLQMDGRAIHEININSGLWIKEHTPHDAIIAVTDAGGVRYFGERYTLDLFGLNNHYIIQHKLDKHSILQQADFLVILPAWSANLKSSDYMWYASFSLPADEYTICHCPSQAEQLILKRDN